jgi:coenzyme F420 hydrogenase subunit beta
LGQDLFDLAKERGVLEFKDLPAENLDKLKNASASKKRACLDKLTMKTGCEDDLIYLDCKDAAVCRIKGV